jgi:hypothetical protein
MGCTAPFFYHGDDGFDVVGVGGAIGMTSAVSPLQSLVAILVPSFLYFRSPPREIANGFIYKWF